MKKIVVGVIIMLVGVFLLFNNLGFIDQDIFHLVISWQSLLIAIGIVVLCDRQPNHHHYCTSTVLIFVGLLFLLPKIFEVSLNGIIFPLLIVGVGIWCVVRAVTKKNKKESERKRVNHLNFSDFEKKSFDEMLVDNEGFIHREYVFTGSKERWTYGEVKNVEIAAVFSGVELDFTQMELSDEVETIRIKVSSVFSGVTLYVPAEWNLLPQNTGSCFGSFVDKRPRSVIQAAQGKSVSLELEAVFGGGEIRCYE